MKCPVDSSDMVKATREGIAIDYYAECGGVWLDRGEFNKIIEKSAAEYAEVRGGEDKDYPDFMNRGTGVNYESPVHFFGRIFDFRR